MAAPGETSRSAPLLGAAAAGGLLWRLAEGRAVLELWRRRQRYRRDLRRLMRCGPHLIEDIGLVPQHAEREADKAFWRP